MNKKKQPKKLSDVKLDYLTGSPFDAQVVRNALSVFGAMIVMAILFVILGMALMMDSAILRVLLNSGVILIALFMFYQTGASRGSMAVNQGEIMYGRRQSGSLVSHSDLKTCYHPAKGFIIGILGALPVVAVALILALTASKQMTYMGALPSWLAAFENRAEIGGALAFYQQPAAWTVEDVSRILVRMTMMPVVNMCSFYGADALLLMERLSPVIVLIPGLCYGAGYLQGVNVRKRVMVGIEEGERKRRKKERRQQRAARTPKGPEQLN